MLKGPSRALPLSSAEETAYNTPPLPFLPILQTNSPLKGFIGLNSPSLMWPLASLTCSGLQHQAFDLVSGFGPVSHFVSSPPMALTGERRGSKAGSWRKERERRPHKEDNNDKKGKEVDGWRIVELHKGQTLFGGPLGSQQDSNSSSHNNWLLSRSSSLLGSVTPNNSNQKVPKILIRSGLWTPGQAGLDGRSRQKNNGMSALTCMYRTEGGVLKFNLGGGEEQSEHAQF